MTGPATAPRSGNSARFASVVDKVFIDLDRHRSTAEHALQIGVDPQKLIRVARGQCCVFTEDLIEQSPWALGRIIALVKAKRRFGSLGARILESVGPTDPSVWGIKETGDPQADLAALLDQVG